MPAVPCHTLKGLTPNTAATIPTSKMPCGWGHRFFNNAICHQVRSSREDPCVWAAVVTVWPTARIPSGPAALCCRRWRHTKRLAPCAQRGWCAKCRQNCVMHWHAHPHGASTTLALAACNAERCTVVHGATAVCTASLQTGITTRDHTQLQRMIDDGEAKEDFEYATDDNVLESCLAADGEETDFFIGCCISRWRPAMHLLYRWCARHAGCNICKPCITHNLRPGTSAGLAPVPCCSEVRQTTFHGAGATASLRENRLGEAIERANAHRRLLG